MDLVAEEFLKISKIQSKKIFGVEPSKAIKVARENNIKNANKIEFKNIKGEDISDNKKFDFVFSLGSDSSHTTLSKSL